jgi:hypothetical protein
VNHRFVDDGRLALAYLGATSGVPVCSWDEDGLGACDRYRSDPVHLQAPVVRLDAANARCSVAFSTPYGDRRCDLPAGHHGYHVRNDAAGRPEYHWGQA